jgi:2-octaprenyl-6-methoxyphenol hydroxylase
MALVGNASHTIHPIAGQGFNLGLRDVSVMTDLVKDALAADQDIGNFALLHAYQINRAKDQQQVIQLTDSLVTLFANDLPPLVIGRNIGLQALNVIAPLKNALVKKTMGY